MSSRPVKPTYWVQGQPGLHKPESCSLFTNPSSQSTAVLVMHIFLEPITCLEGRATSWVLLGLRFGAKLLISPQIICADCLESLRESTPLARCYSLTCPFLMAWTHRYTRPPLAHLCCGSGTRVKDSLGARLPSSSAQSEAGSNL